jgi:hypothetical protein
MKGDRIGGQVKYGRRVLELFVQWLEVTRFSACNESDAIDGGREARPRRIEPSRNPICIGVKQSKHGQNKLRFTPHPICDVLVPEFLDGYFGRPDGLPAQHNAVQEETFAIGRYASDERSNRVFAQQWQAPPYLSKKVKPQGSQNPTS